MDARSIRSPSQPPPKRRASGPTQPEAERTREQLKLRLAPETIARLRARAAAEGLTLSDYVARLIATDLAIT